MYPVHDAFMTTDGFRFSMPTKDLVTFSFGATQVTMSLDASYDLQFRLASFLAQLELKDYAVEHRSVDDSLPEDERTAECRAALEAFAVLPTKGRRLDS